MPEPASIQKVLMTADCVGGVWSYCLELARSEAFRELTLCLAVLGGPVPRRKAQEALRVPNLQLEEISGQLEWMEDPWEDMARAGDWLLELEDRFAPDLVHLNGYSHGALPFRAPKLVAGHSCVLSWWQAVKQEEAPASWNRYRQAVTMGLRGADLVIAPSRAMLDSLAHFYGPLPNARVIYNGRRPQDFQPGVKEPLILSAGRVWDEAKNIAALTGMASELSWPVYVAGENQHPASAGRVEAADRVTFLGQLTQEDLAEWYGKAAIYVLPAWYEPFGLSILEAALSGCVLVLGDIPSLREIWGEAALYVPPGDPDSLKRVLQDLCDHPARRIELSALAQCRAPQYAAEAMATAYRTAYLTLLAKRQAATEELVPCG